jgi:hypothetical protein
MADVFLERQLKRLREMSERMSQARERAAELAEQIDRDRKAIPQGPLQEVRDFRYHPGMRGDQAEPEAPRRSTANESPRRRRRR